MAGNMRWLVASAATLIVVGGSGVAAQVAPAPDAAARVRDAVPCADARIPERRATRASCSSVDPSSTTVSVEGEQGPAAVDPGTLTRLQTSREATSHARRGAVLGALVGGIATYLVLHHGGSTSLCDHSANQDAMGSRECWGLTVLGGLAGAGVGAWVGGRFRVERRQTLPAPTR